MWTSTAPVESLLQQVEHPAELDREAAIGAAAVVLEGPNADRIVNAVAGFEKYRSALIIVDFGTATTFDYVNRKGEYCGGAIAPGLANRANASNSLGCHRSALQSGAKPSR